MSNTVATTHHQIDRVHLSRERERHQEQQPSNPCTKQISIETSHEMTPKSKLDNVLMHSTKFMEEMKTRRQLWFKKASENSEHVPLSSITKLPHSRRRNLHITSINSSSNNINSNGNKVQVESLKSHEELAQGVHIENENTNANTAVSDVVMENQPIPAQRVIAIGKKHTHQEAPHFTSHKIFNGNDKTSSLPINTTTASVVSSVSAIASQRQVKMINSHTRPSVVRTSAARERNVQSTVSNMDHTTFTSTKYNNNTDNNSVKDGGEMNHNTESYQQHESNVKGYHYSHTSPESIILVKTNTTSRANENNSEASLHTSPSSSPRSLLSSANNFSHPLGKKIYCVRANDSETVDSHVSPFAIASSFATKNNNNNNNNNNYGAMKNLNGVNTLSASHNSLMSSRSNTVASLGKMRTKAPVTMRKIINLSLSRYSLLRIVAKHMNFTVEESEEELNEFNFNLC